MAPKKVAAPKAAAAAVATEKTPEKAIEKAAAAKGESKPSAETKKEVKAEMIKQAEAEEQAKKPGKAKRCIKCAIKSFILLTGAIMFIMGIIGYIQLFGGSATFEYAKNNYNMLISRILTNFWYLAFSLILFSGMCTIPVISKYFGFTKSIVGYSIFLLFLGFALSGPNLEGTLGINATTDAEKLLNKLLIWIRGIVGIVFIILGILGMIYGCFKKAEDEDDEEGEQEK